MILFPGDLLWRGRCGALWDLLTGEKFKDPSFAPTEVRRMGRADDGVARGTATLGCALGFCFVICPCDTRAIPKRTAHKFLRGFFFGCGYKFGVRTFEVFDFARVEMPDAGGDLVYYVVVVGDEQDRAVIFLQRDV